MASLQNSKAFLVAGFEQPENRRGARAQHPENPARRAADFEELLSKLSAAFVHVSVDELDNEIERWLERPTTIPAANATLAPSQTLHLGWVELSRQELYEKVWSQPALTLAQEFGISDRGLGKICARFEIPVPPRGYWQKLSAGQRLEKAPLPRLKTKAPSKIQIRRSPIDTDAAISTLA
jgi:hypothetical protein